MSSYLTVAEEILRDARRPLSAKSILRIAYQQGLVADHLYGKTQHKTLQARLSEDILHRRERSCFFRTEPGKFFLRDFLTDPAIPAVYKKEMRARRRTRELLRGPALAFSHRFLKRVLFTGVAESSKLGSIGVRSTDEMVYVEPKAVPEDVALVWSVAAVRRDRHILAYRTGRYRDNRDTFAQKRSICFAALVLESDVNLFDASGLGVVDAALTAVSTDLNVQIDHRYDASTRAGSFGHDFRCIVWDDHRPDEVLALVEICAPDWFEPAQSSLSINDLCWIDLTAPPNDIMDFDPWSRSLLEKCYNSWTDHGNGPIVTACLSLG
ncbi:winged helix-turn-helix domain-containing protein [Paracoccus sp. P2]|uniref:winged helix-turn-helix domain-containing protein n=1 Tax=Paracoccus sp. P2 TaxID=3248840 RepID=UPI00391F1D74